MSWVEKDHNDHWVSTPLLCAGSPTTRPGCPEPHLAWPWMPPGWGIHSLLGQPVPVRHHSLCENLLPNIQPKPSLSSPTSAPCIPKDGRSQHRMASCCGWCTGAGHTPCCSTRWAEGTLTISAGQVEATCKDISSINTDAMCTSPQNGTLTAAPTASLSSISNQTGSSHFCTYCCLYQVALPLGTGCSATWAKPYWTVPKGHSLDLVAALTLSLPAHGYCQRYSPSLHSTWTAPCSSRSSPCLTRSTQRTAQPHLHSRTIAPSPSLALKKNKEDLQLNILEGHCLGDHSEQNLESYASHSSSLPTPKWFLWTSQHWWHPPRCIKKAKLVWRRAEVG